jgi:hypothetical protein
MGMFQVGGHMFSSIAISKIPVSTVHTIKVCWSIGSSFLRDEHAFRLYLHCSPLPLTPCFSASSTPQGRTSL